MKRNSIVGVASVAVLGLVACSSQEPADGSLRGELRIANLSFDDGHSERQFFLAPEGSDELTPLVFTKQPDVAALSRLKVWGAIEGENLLVDRYEVVEDASAETASAREPLLNGVRRTRTVGFVLMDTGNGSDLTPAQAQTSVFGTRGASNASLREYYLEASYNTLEFTGQVFETDVSLPSGCSTNGLMTIANGWQNQFGVNMDHWMGYIGQQTSACGWSGVGWEGNANTAQKVSFYNSSDGCVVLAQEIGHNLGWMHAGTMDCGTQIMPDNPSSCTGTEYGSRISPMGGACLHLNAYDKWYRGFFGGCNGVRVPSSGTFTLLPLEIPCDGVQALQIPMPKTRAFANSSGGGNVTLSRYYLEFRTKRGLDDKSAIPGPRVFVHVAGDTTPANRSATFDWVLDMDPTTSAFDGMTVGQTFNDPAGGVSFTLTAADNDRATVNVEIAAGSGSPTCMDGSAFTAPGPATCGATGGTGGMGGMGGMAGTAGRGAGGMAGRGGMPGTGGIAGRGGAPNGGIGGMPGAGSGGVAGGVVGGTPGGGASGAAGLGGFDAGGAPAGAAGVGVAGAPVAGAAGVGVSGSAGTGGSGAAGAPGTGGATAGTGGDGPIIDPDLPESLAADDGGCGCRTAPARSASSAWWALTLLALGWARRRKLR